MRSILEEHSADPKCGLKGVNCPPTPHMSRFAEAEGSHSSVIIHGAPIKVGESVARAKGCGRFAHFTETGPQPILTGNVL